MIGRGRQQQPSAASRTAHGQNQRVALRLLDLIDAAAGQTALQLTTDRREENASNGIGFLHGQDKKLVQPVELAGEI